jgi:hypothetical protein
VRDAGVPPKRVRPSGYFFFRLDLSVTVVRGFRFAVGLETNRPLMALLARVMRLPPVFFFAAIVPPSLGPPLIGHGSSVPTPVHRMRAPACNEVFVLIAAGGG